MKKENIWNVPNALTLIRVILTPIIIYWIFNDSDPVLILGGFAIGMLTDFFDGRIAHHFNQKTEFGRKFDILADRFIVLGVFLAIAIHFSDIILKDYVGQLLPVFSREILAFPFVIMSFALRQKIHPARFVGKLTTFVQAVTFGLIMLELYYSRLGWVTFFSAATGMIGAIAAFTYMQDVMRAIRTK